MIYKIQLKKTYMNTQSAIDECDAISGDTNMEFEVVLMEDRIRMKAALFNIGDEVNRIDCDDPKTYTIDKIREHQGYWMYSMEGQGWVDSWAWVAEWNIERSES